MAWSMDGSSVNPTILFYCHVSNIMFILFTRNFGKTQNGLVIENETCVKP